MAELVVDYTLLFITTIIALIGGLVAVIVLRSGGFIQKQREKLQKKYIKELEDELEYAEKRAKTYQAKYARSTQLDPLSSEISLDSDDGVAQAIKEIVPQLAPMLPKQIRGLLNDPKAIDVALELYKKDPEKAKQLLGSFISKGKKGESQPNQSGIPDFDPNLTV